MIKTRLSKSATQHVDFEIYNEVNLFSDYDGCIRVWLTTVGTAKEQTQATLMCGDYAIHTTTEPKVHVLVRFKDGKECFTTIKSYSNITVTKTGRLIEHLYGERG